MFSKNSLNSFCQNLPRVIKIFIYLIFIKKTKSFDFKYLIIIEIFFVLLVPHLIWLFNNEFITLAYGFKRIGFEEAATKIQDLFLDGKRAEATAAVPQELIDQVALVGSKDRIKDKLAEWKEAANKRHVDTLIARTDDIDTVRFLAENVL